MHMQNSFSSAQERDPNLLKRIIGYARESTRDQAMNGFNLDEQERRIRQYINVYYSDPNNLFLMIREEGASAKSLNRPRMREIIQSIKNNEIDVLVIHNLDRLTRSLCDMQSLLQLFTEHHVELISLQEKIDTEEPQGRFFISMIVLIAQWEQETIGDRAVRGKRESASQGNYAKARVPFGYYRNPENTKHLLIDENKANVVRYIFQSIADGEYTSHTIAQQLKKDNVYNRRWKDSYIEKIIHNKIYYGTFAWYDDEFENHQPAIISKELWEQANAVLNIGKNKRHEYLFKGNVQCGCCNCTCGHKSGKNRYLYYVCPKCNSYINEKRVLESVLDSLNTIIQNHFCYRDIRRLNVKANVLRYQMNSLTECYSYQRISKSYYIEMMGLYYSEKKEIESRINSFIDSIRKMTFTTIDDDVLAEIMSTYVSFISVDYITKTAEVVTNENYKRILKYV